MDKGGYEVDPAPEQVPDPVPESDPDPLLGVFPDPDSVAAATSLQRCSAAALPADLCFQPDSQASPNGAMLVSSTEPSTRSINCLTNGS